MEFHSKTIQGASEQNDMLLIGLQKQNNYKRREIKEPK